MAWTVWTGGKRWVWSVGLALLFAFSQVTLGAVCDVTSGGIARRWDPLLQRYFELHQDCLHPEWPARLVVARSNNAASFRQPVSAAPFERGTPSAFLVHVGDSVRLWLQEERVRIELVGVAEQAGENGQKIKVRVLPTGTESWKAVSYVTGVVRGEGDVEMER